ncbi:hypothetical protein ACN4EG_20830 [Alkalinema pantanalense CENA528]
MSAIVIQLMLNFTEAVEKYQRSLPGQALLGERALSGETAETP